MAQAPEVHTKTGGDLHKHQDLVNEIIDGLKASNEAAIAAAVDAATAPLNQKIDGLQTQIAAQAEQYNPLLAAAEITKQRLDHYDASVKTGEKFAGAALTAGMPDGEAHWERLTDIGSIFLETFKAYNSQGQSIDRAKFKADSSGETNAAGGGLIPPEWWPDVMRVEIEASIPMKRFQRVNMTRRKVSFPVESAVPTMYWTAAENTGPASASNYVLAASNAELAAKTMMAVLKASEEVVEDSIVPFQGFLAKIFLQAAGLEHNKQAFVGTGSPFTGLATLSGVGDVSQGGTSTSGATAAKDVKLPDITALMAKIPSPLIWGGEFYCNPQAFQNCITMTDDNGRREYVAGFAHNIQSQPLSQVPNTLTTAPALLMGRPVYFTDVLPANPTPGQPWLIYGSPEYAFFGDLKAITIDWDKSIYFLLGALAMRLTQRCVPGFYPVPSAFARLSTAAS